MTSTRNVTRSVDSTDRMPALSISRPAGAAPTRKSTAARIGSAGRRILNALMQALASPHV